MKTKGQELYEADVVKTPNYHTGKPRPRWDELSETAQAAWQRDWELIQHGNSADDDGA